MKEQDQYTHVEAFALMTYECEGCGKRERIWNSRDGVTPFIIGCRYCGAEAKHIEWHHNQCVPNYKPKAGERIFIDMSMEKALEIAKKRLEMSKGSQFEVPEEQYEAFLKGISESIYCDGSTPTLKVITEDDCKQFYIWSKKWTKDFNHIFWAPNSSGYTRDLNTAGIYSLEEIKRKCLPIMTKDNLQDLKQSNHEDMAIAIEDIELLGKKIVCVLN